ncbi:MAG TPA: ABC transporter ATP-binding protein, partial [Actinomycetota bacterium]|nr:ABC transporter ATP-binding protein [Actinomycetota bacterium]
MGRHMRFYATPAEKPDKPVDRATVKRVVGTFRPYRGKVWIVGVLIAITSGLGVVNPLLIVYIFNHGLFGLGSPPICQGGPCPNMHIVLWGVAFMITIPIITGVLGIGQTYYANFVGLRVMQDLRDSLYRHLQHMPLRFFTSTRTGEIQSRLSNDVGGVQTVVTDTASSILSNVVVIISTLVAMLFLSVPLTLLSLCLMPFFLWLTVKVGRARREVATTTQKTMADMTAVTEETLSVSGILLSKTFGRQDYEIGRFQQENERLTGLQVRQTMIGRSFFAVVGTFFSITPALVYLVAGIVNGNAGSDPSKWPINAGIIVGFTTLQSRLFFPIGSMLQVSTDVQSSFALFDRIFEYLDLRHDIVDAPDAEPLVN